VEYIPYEGGVIGVAVVAPVFSKEEKIYYKMVSYTLYLYIYLS